MSDVDIRQERDEFQQVLIEIAELVAPFVGPFADEDITDPTCDPDHIVRAVEYAVAAIERVDRLNPDCGCPCCREWGLGIVRALYGGGA